MMLPGTAMLMVHFRPELGLKVAVGLEVSRIVELCSLLESCFRYSIIRTCNEFQRMLRTFLPMLTL